MSNPGDRGCQNEDLDAESRQAIRERAEETVDADLLETMRKAARRNAHLPDH